MLRKSALSILLVLLASLPVAAQSFLDETQEVITWLNSVAYQDSILIVSGTTGEIVADRLNPCDCNPVISLFEIETGRSWADAREILWDQGYILQCATGMNDIPETELTMNSLFLFKVLRTEMADLNQYLIPGLQPFRTNRLQKVYFVEPIVIPFSMRGYQLGGIAIEGPSDDGSTVPYVFEAGAGMLPSTFASAAFWRHIVRSGIWETDELRPTFIPYLRERSIEWLKDSFQLAHVWQTYLEEVSAVNRRQFIANEVSHTLSDRRWHDDVPCPMPDSVYQAFEALSDATSLHIIADPDSGSIHFFMMFANSYFRRVESSGYAGYAESERIFRQTGQWLLDGLTDQLREDGQTEWREQLGLSRVQHQGDLRSIFLDIYFLFDDEAYRRYVVEPFAAHYGELTLERLQELGIDINKR